MGLSQGLVRRETRATERGLPNCPCWSLPAQAHRGGRSWHLDHRPFCTRASCAADWGTVPPELKVETAKQASSLSALMRDCGLCHAISRAVSACHYSDLNSSNAGETYLRTKCLSHIEHLYGRSLVWVRSWRSRCSLHASAIHSPARTLWTVLLVEHLVAELALLFHHRDDARRLRPKTLCLDDQNEAFARTINRANQAGGDVISGQMCSSKSPGCAGPVPLWQLYL